MVEMGIHLPFFPHLYMPAVQMLKVIKGKTQRKSGILTKLPQVCESVHFFSGYIGAVRTPAQL